MGSSTKNYWFELKNKKKKSEVKGKIFTHLWKQNLFPEAEEGEGAHIVKSFLKPEQMESCGLICNPDGQFCRHFMFIVSSLFSPVALYFTWR